jgi:CPA1 family monovalent cation:H+ antiporter
MPTLDSLLALLALIAVMALAAPRLRTPLPIALTLGGLVLAVVPGIPHPRLPPAFVLYGLLPPLLYADAFRTSFRDFVRWLRPILLLAIGLVAVTTLTVGLATRWLVPELPWAACFALGAILSPTDTVATQAVLERLRIPRRATAILGGESLVNDGTGLVGVQLCTAVLMTGAFELGGVAGRLLLVTGGGVGIGLVTGLVFAEVNRRVRDPKALFVLSLVAPYLATVVALRVSASAVLAVVVAGGFVGWRMRVVERGSRRMLYTVWDQLVFLFNAASFAYIGLEAPALFATIEDGRARILAGAALVTGVVVLTRIFWVVPMAYFPPWLNRGLRAREGGFPPLRNVLLASWCGVRGSISLAAALALPLTVAGGAPYPGRDRIVFVTLCVVILTLFAQGLTLAPLARLLDVRGDDDAEHETRRAREALLQAGIARLDAFCNEVSCPLAVHHLRDAMQDELESLREHDEAASRRARQRLDVSRDVRHAIHQAQSQALLALRDSQQIDDLLYIQLQLEIDRAHPANGAA